jgi:hypothetical protein
MEMRSSNGGFAMLLAVVALLLLSAIGLTLALTSTTETEMTANYRAARQAQYASEAGMELGKGLLRDLSWDALLPRPREGTWDPSGASPPVPAAPQGGATRNFENGACDVRGGRVGYGVVLNDGTAVYENQGAALGATLPGAFTLWVRRPVVRNQDGTFADYAHDNDELVLTAEGRVGLPRVWGHDAGSSAVRVLEVTLARAHTAPCLSRSEQAGAGADGAGFEACLSLDDDTLSAERGLGGGGKPIDADQN